MKRSSDTRRSPSEEEVRRAIQEVGDLALQSVLANSPAAAARTTEKSPQSPKSPTSTTDSGSDSSRELSPDEARLEMGRELYPGFSDEEILEILNET